MYHQSDSTSFLYNTTVASCIIKSCIIQSKRSPQYDTNNIGTGQVTRFINNIIRFKKGQYLKLFKFEI